MNTTPRLTDDELSVVLDRLELDGGGCIAEVLCVYSEEDDPVVEDNPEEVIARTKRLAETLTKTRCVPVGLTDLDKAILAECVEGSTCAVRCSDDPTLYRHWVKVLKSLAEKLIEAGVADDIYVPEC